MIPRVEPQSPLSSTINKIARNAEANAITSKDLKVQQSSNGATIQLASNYKNFPTVFLQYQGEYNPDAGYTVNDVVRVLSTTTYTSSVTGGTLSPSPGVWICVADIPNWKISNELSQQGWQGPSQYVRHDTAKYSPFYPEPTTLASVTNPTGRYWDLISLLPVSSNVCVDGETVTTYIDSYQSGSV